MGKKFSDEKYNTPWGDSGGDWFSKGASKNAPCYESHPPLLLKADGKEYEIYGGSCSNPVVSNADIYIGFDSYSMRTQAHKMPWEEGYSPIIEINFPIQDMSVPKDADRFVKLVDWTCNQLQNGKLIHAGCIGGHGRTGMFLAAVTRRLTGEKDAITYVRENYCKKAVESDEQSRFLEKHFGIEVKKGYKQPVESTVSSRGWSAVSSMAQGAIGLHKNVMPFPSKKTISPVPSKRNIW